MNNDELTSDDRLSSTRPPLKEKVEFWKEVKNNLWALSLYYASVAEQQIKNVP